MFENVDIWTTDGRTTDGRTDAGVTGILIAHLGAFSSGELRTYYTIFNISVDTCNDQYCSQRLSEDDKSRH